MDAPLKGALALAKASPAAPPGAFHGRGSWLETLVDRAPPGVLDGEGSALKRARLVAGGSGGSDRITARQPTQQLPGKTDPVGVVVSMC